jgi:hypothetical protein
VSRAQRLAISPMHMTRSAQRRPLRLQRFIHAPCISSISRTRAEGDAEILRFMCCPPSSAGSHTHCSGALVKPVKALAIPFAFPSPLLRERIRENRGKPFASRADQSKHPHEPIRLKEIQSEGKPRNCPRKASASLYDTPQLRHRKGLSGIRPSQQGRSRRRREASRSWRNCSAAIAGAMTWLPVSSSGEIADVARVSVNAMDRPP